MIERKAIHNRRPLVQLWICLSVVALLGGCGKPQGAPARANVAQPPSQEDSFEKGVDLPPSPRTLYAAARILKAQGRASEYDAALMRIIKQYPQWLPAYCDMARLRLQQRL